MGFLFLSSNSPPQISISLKYRFKFNFILICEYYYLFTDNNEFLNLSN